MSSNQSDTHETLLKNPSTAGLLAMFRGLNGFQRSNRFYVDVTPPVKLQGKWGAKTPRLFATSVQIPAQVINYYQDTVSPSGSLFDIPVKREYDDRFIIDFIVDSNWEARQFWHDWMEHMFKSSLVTSTTGYKNSIIINYWSEIVGTVDIYALSTATSTTTTDTTAEEMVNRRISLIDAWPGTILPTQMMYDTPNDYLMLSVDINYRQYAIYDKDNRIQQIPN